MGFLSDFFRAYVDTMENAGFIEGFFIFVLFVFLISMAYGMLFVAVVLLAVALCNWWSGAGAGAATAAPAAPEEPALGWNGGWKGRWKRGQRGSTTGDGASTQPN